MRRVPFPLVITAACLLLLHCAGAPPARELESWQDLRGQALRQIERFSPEALYEATGFLQSADVPKSFRAEAGELASLAARLYRLLFPELTAQGRAPSARDYAGPYAPLLELAERGLAPSAELTASTPTVAEDGQLPRILSFLYLHRAEQAKALEEDEAEAARLALEQAAIALPHSALPPYLLGLIQERRGALEQAAARFQACLALAASFYPARVHLAEVERGLRRPAEAAANLSMTLAVLPDNIDLLRKLVETELEAGSSAAALAGSAQLLLREPQNPEFLLLRARALLAAGEWSQALKPLNLLLAAHPDAREALLLRARILFEKAREEEPALRTLADADRRYPDDPRFPELSGRILLAIGRESEGLQELGRALKLEPERASSLRFLLDYYAGRKRWLQAAMYAARLLEKQPSHEDLLQAYRVYQHLGAAAELRATAERLYALDPSPANAALYAAALMDDGRAEEAGRLAEKALPGADPASRSRLLVVKARISERQDVDQAVRLLQQALLADPHNLEALTRLAELHVARREYRQARQYLRQAVELAPQDPGLRLRLQKVEREAGRS